MEAEFIPYELALRMKQLGFDEPCFAWYYGKDLWIVDQEESKPMNYRQNPIRGGNGIFAPLYQQAFRWFREKYGICSWIERIYTADSICYYRYTCEYKKDPSSKTHEVILSIKEYNTYEEAELACHKKLIEIVEQNKSE
jgi:hypothetical protein